MKAVIEENFLATVCDLKFIRPHNTNTYSKSYVPLMLESYPGGSKSRSLTVDNILGYVDDSRHGYSIL